MIRGRKISTIFVRILTPAIVHPSQGSVKPSAASRPACAAACETGRGRRLGVMRERRRGPPRCVGPRPLQAGPGDQGAVQRGGRHQPTRSGRRSSRRSSLSGGGRRLTAGRSSFSARKGGGLLPVVTNIAAAAVIAAGLAALLVAVRQRGAADRRHGPRPGRGRGRAGRGAARGVGRPARRAGPRGRGVAAPPEGAHGRARSAQGAGRRRPRRATARAWPPSSAGSPTRSAALERAREDRRAAEAAAASAPRQPRPPPPPALPPQPLAESARLADSERLALERLAASYRGFEREAREAHGTRPRSASTRSRRCFAEDAVARLPVIQRIRPVEAGDGLRPSAACWRGRAMPRLPRAPSQADELLGRVTALVRQAEARFRAGQVAPAETLYLSALSEIPDVRTGYERLVGIQRARWQEEQAALNRAAGGAAGRGGARAAGACRRRGRSRPRAAGARGGDGRTWRASARRAGRSRAAGRRG